MTKELLFEQAQFTLSGLVGILFDRFIDMSEQDKPPEEKLYLAEGNKVVLPSENIYGLLYTEKPAGCAKRFEGRKGKDYIANGMAYTAISPEIAPFLRAGEEIIFQGFENEYDQNARIRVMHHKANVLKSGRVIPAPKARPMLETPWQVTFTVQVFKNRLININKIYNWLVQGGLEIGLCAFRPRFGRFTVEMK